MTRAARGTTEVSSYIAKARILYSNLEIKLDAKHPKEADNLFLKKVVGISHEKNWYRTGIKPIYWKLLNFLEENQKLKQDKEQLNQEVQRLKKELAR